MSMAEDATFGTLSLVAACAAPIVPWGTVASVVITAGISIYKINDAIDKAELQSLLSTQEFKDKIAALGTFIDHKNIGELRPTVPLDLYSGPPMYWVVDSDPVFTSSLNADKSYRIPGGNVDWPCANIGGSTLMPGQDPKDINLDFVYGAMPPAKNSTPSICVFFWAVPIFFARIQQRIGEFIFSLGVGGYDPSADATQLFPISKILPTLSNPNPKGTVGEVVAQITKQILEKGKLDSAGNWFGQIGIAIPPLARKDDEYAARYYGRSSWCHNLAMENIRYSDGTKMFYSGIPNTSYGKNTESITYKHIVKSTAAATVGPRYVYAGDLKTVVPQSGHIFDLRALLSNYYVVDPYFIAARRTMTVDETALYYVTTIEDLEESYRAADEAKYFNWGSGYFYGAKNYRTIVNKSAARTSYFKTQSIPPKDGLTVSGIYQAIGDSGGFARYGISANPAKTKSGPGGPYSNINDPGIDTENTRYVASMWHGHFALAPFSLFVVAENTAQQDGTSPPRPILSSGINPVTKSRFSTYAFMDFDPEEFKNDFHPGLPTEIGEIISEKYRWLRELAIMPGSDESMIGKGYAAIEKTGYYNSFNWAYNSTSLMKLSGTEFKLASTRYYTFNPGIVKIGGYSIWDILKSKQLLKSDADEHQLMSKIWDVKKAGDIRHDLPTILEIIKTRPPNAYEKSNNRTVKLTREYWSDVQWALDLSSNNKSLETEGVEFAVQAPDTPFLYRLAIIKFTREQMLKFQKTDAKNKPITSAYYRTNLSENKPIVDVSLTLSDKKTPSPFYCGRRADARSLPAWKVLRAASLKLSSGAIPDSSESGWEDCHDWSWPYVNNTLSNIGNVSLSLYHNPLLREGIGRAGLSPSSIATGPTLWGDLSLYSKVYPSLLSGKSDKPYDENGNTNKGFENTKAICIWDTIVEMQVGSFARYPRTPYSQNQTLSDIVAPRFGSYVGDAAAREIFKKDAQAAAANGNPPAAWNSSKGLMEVITADQAADLCISIANSWYNGTFPKPTPSYQALFSKGWDAGTLEKVATAHIRLKNWALDLGKPENERVGHEFPNDLFSINFFGLNKASSIAIDSYNAAMNAKLEDVDPLSAITKILDHEKVKVPVIPINLPVDPDAARKRKKKIVIASGVAAVSIAATIAALTSHHKT